MGLCHFLESHPGMHVVGQAADSRQALSQTLQKRPDLIIYDLNLGPLNGVEFVVRMRELMTGEMPRILLLGREATNDQLLTALSARVDGVIWKSAAHNELPVAMNSISAGHIFLSPRFVTQLLSNFVLLPANANPTASAEIRDLTDRELAVLELISKGLSNAEIANKLHLAETTVKAYSSRLFEKLGVRDRLQAALLAISVGMVQPTLGSPLLWSLNPSIA